MKHPFLLGLLVACVGAFQTHRRQHFRVSPRSVAVASPPCTTPTKHDLATGRDPERVKIFDTTLRDGEQSPGCTMTAEEKMQVARQLARMGVDVIEAGFPFASPGDFEAVQRIANEVCIKRSPSTFESILGIGLLDNFLFSTGWQLRRPSHHLWSCSGHQK